MKTTNKSEIQFTEAQQECIDARNCDVLVSAAAGSGKTAVLVERIIQLIMDPEHPINVDELLVVTFTKAAAAQMRDKIAKAITKRLALEPNNEHLERQAALVHNAQITTIDSFCTFVIRNNFGDIGLDPGFRVGDEGEMKLLRQDVLEETLEACFEQGEEAFITLADSFRKGIHDKALEDIIMQLYNTAMSYPFPKTWLLERKKDYEASKLLSECDWYQVALEQMHLLCQLCVTKMQECIALCETSNGPYMFGEMVEAEEARIQTFMRKLEEGANYAQLQAAVETITFGKLSPKKDESVDSDLRERVKDLRNEVKEQIKKIKERYLLYSEDRIATQTAICMKLLGTVIDVVLEFQERFSTKKRDKNVLDFSDLEHFALEILIKEAGQEDGLVYQQTETAKEYAKHFKYIMIDEYQDSNLVQEYLLESISGEFQGSYNRFMVGDVKQSIYKFRLAKPEIFLEKYQQYEPGGRDRRRIDLQQNFRSRKEVLDATNYIFERVMQKELGGISYDEAARLNLGANYPENDGMQAEVLLFQNEEDEDSLTSKELEAYGIANRIKKLMQECQVTDEKTGALRPVQWKDIVILLRSMSGYDDVFKKVLEEQGIPVFVTTRTGYFGALEVRVLLQLLKIINNPLQDIPFYGALHSFITGLEDNEIAHIRSFDPDFKGLLYEACVHFVDSDMPVAKELQSIHQSAKAKLQVFLERLDTYRSASKDQSIYELLDIILEDTEYRTYLMAMPGGEKRVANVDMLLQKASDFESTSFFGLYDFIRYMELLEKYAVDYGEANTLGEQADVVRIMTMHSSKGLEFPVCFVAGLSKKINMKDITGNVLIDAKYGVGMKCIDLGRRTMTDTLRRCVVAEQMRQDNLAEELRILYVALTRAKEKLIMTGLWKGKEDLRLEKPSLPNVLYAKTMMDFILLAYDENAPMDLQIIDFGEMKYEEAGDIISRRMLRIQLENELCKPTKDEQRDDTVYDIESIPCEQELCKQIKTKITSLHNATYAHENLKNLHTKTSVSELKKAAMQEADEEAYVLFEEKEYTPYLPKFLKEEEVTGTVRGNAYHKFMELLDFELLLVHKATPKLIRDEIKRMRDSGKLSEEYAKVLWVDKLVTFCQSDVALRMAKASKSGKLYREQPFVLGIAASRLQATFPEEETVLIQGIIDAFFEEDGKYILLDYKTDRVEAEQQLLARYQEQMNYYEEAIGAMKGKVVEKLIYSFALQKEIMV